MEMNLLKFYDFLIYSNERNVHKMSFKLQIMADNYSKFTFWEPLVRNDLEKSFVWKNLFLPQGNMDDIEKY